MEGGTVHTSISRTFNLPRIQAAYFSHDDIRVLDFSMSNNKVILFFHYILHVNVNSDIFYIHQTISHLNNHHHGDYEYYVVHTVIIL